jgi:site-specific recombinase XerD
MIRKRCTQAGLSDEITAHSFRRHYITAGIKKGVDLAILQRAVFHANVSTTASYSQIEDSEVLEAVANVAQYPKTN